MSRRNRTKLVGVFSSVTVQREDRFTRLFEDTYASIWAYTRRRVAPDEVDDVVAEVMAIAWRRLEEVPADPLPWLYRTAYHTISNHRRSRRRRLRLAERLASEPAPRPDDDEQLAVREALSTLRPEDQELLRLAAWEQLGPADIATVLGCTTNAAALRLSRARQKLRDRMTGSEGSRTRTERKEIDA